jgi:hypothetical protein
MIYIVINGVPILAATLAGLLFGVLYYGVVDRSRIGSPATLVLAFVAEAWLCAILAGALILAPPKGSVWTMTLGSAFVIWLGFVVPSIAVSFRFRALPGRAVLIDCGYLLGVMLVQAVVLRLIGLMPPPV